LYIVVIDLHVVDADVVHTDLTSVDLSYTYLLHMKATTNVNVVIYIVAYLIGSQPQRAVRIFLLCL